MTPIKDAVNHEKQCDQDPPAQEVAQEPEATVQGSEWGGREGCSLRAALHRPQEAHYLDQSRVKSGAERQRGPGSGPSFLLTRLSWLNSCWGRNEGDHHWMYNFSLLSMSAEQPSPSLVSENRASCAKGEGPWRRIFFDAVWKLCYCWHHEVLKIIADSICSRNNHCKCIRPAKKTISSFRAGQRPTAASRTSCSCLLLTAQDWELKVDPGKQVPRDHTRCEPMEVGCRGFTGRSSPKVGHRRGNQAKGQKDGHRGRCLKVGVDQERGTAWAVVLPGHKLGLDQSRLCCLGEGVCYTWWTQDTTPCVQVHRKMCSPENILKTDLFHTHVSTTQRHRLFWLLCGPTKSLSSSAHSLNKRKQPSLCPAS